MVVVKVIVIVMHLELHLSVVGFISGEEWQPEQLKEVLLVDMRRQVKMQGFSLAISILWVLLSWSLNIIFIKIFLDWTLLASYQFPMQFLICLVNYHLPLPPPLTSLPSYPSFPYFPSIFPLLSLPPFNFPPHSLTCSPPRLSVWIMDALVWRGANLYNHRK